MIIRSEPLYELKFLIIYFFIWVSETNNFS